MLLQIRTYQPLTQMELAEKVTVTQGGISRMLTRLEKKDILYENKIGKRKQLVLQSKEKQL